MPATKEQLLQVTRRVLDIWNQGQLTEEGWNYIGDFDNYVNIDPIGIAVGKAEAEANWKAHQGVGLTMEPRNIQVTMDWIPGMHQVEFDTDFKWTKPFFEGLPSEIPGHVYYLFNSDGKIIRVHNEIAGSGPDADKYASMLADAMIKFWGAKLEDGLEHARSALVDVVERLNTLDPATVVEHTTDDAVLIAPINITRGKEANIQNVAKFIAVGLHSCKLITPVISVAPYTAKARIEYDFSKLPEGCNVEKVTRMDLQVTIVPESGKVKRISTLPYGPENRAWNAAVINWLRAHQPAPASQPAA